MDIHGGGRLELSGNNSFGGGIGVQKGALRVKSNHALGSTLGNTVVDATAAAGGGLEFEGDLDIAESIELDGSNGNLLRVISGFVALTNGLYISNPSCGIEVLANAQLGIIGDVSMGDIQKRGPGQLVIKGNVAGIFNANEGISVLRGNGSAFKMTGGDASIDGAVGLFNGTGGRWLTDAEFPATVHGATTFGAGFTFEMDRVQSATAAQAGLVAEQAPSLNGAHLSLLRSADVGPPGSVLHLINNTSGQAVNGSFSGLPEGAMVSASQGSMASFRISYAGGDGNDITLTVVGASAADSADLGLTGSGSPEPATAGANVTYSVQVANFGPSDAHDVVFTAQVVAGSSFVALNASSNWSCTFPSVGATGQVRCTRDTLALNGGSTIMLRVTIDSARTANLVTAFHVAASTADPALANNDLSVTAHIGTAAPPPGPGSGSALPYRRFVMQVAQD